MQKNKENTAIYVAFEELEPFDPSKPEKNLLRAVLASAMNDLRQTGDVGRKAHEYFLSRDERYIFSFRSVCNFLDLDPKTMLWVVGLREDSLGRTRPNEKSKECSLAVD